MKARARGKMPKIATIYDHQNDKAIISLANRNKTQSEYIHGIHLPLYESQQFQRQYIWLCLYIYYDNLSVSKYRLFNLNCLFISQVIFLQI